MKVEYSLFRKETNSTMHSELGILLKKLRGKRTLRDVSEKTGLSHTYIRDLELGIRRATGKPIKPSAHVLKKLADAYQYPFEELMRASGYEDLLQKNTNGDSNPCDIWQILSSENETALWKGRVLDEQQKKEIISVVEYVLSRSI
ncbi:helix-turn-helix domain-containing protein [Thermoactinomyces sp. CICC 24226]|uniref:helix-turn-helix domain-containing protein n=1 Tax=Thermoactinomyces sp. CICC 24226 TaxID=2767431 RepID=UPI0018DC1E19|nr:helix-turn-helix transcriptional regulator [Thermoactinomyces sp. CICC 24226]MBI0392578.1 helix-turn-helix domain-containing protein [Thermoactinomyces sp. CICC 24226]